jgi:hypothetical protein
LREGRVLPTIPAINPDDIFEEQDPDKSISNEDDEPPPLARRTGNEDADAEDDYDDYGEQDDGEPQNGEQPKQQLPAELDIGRTVLMPIQPDGQRFRAKIIERVDAYKRHLSKERDANAQYKVLVGHDNDNTWEEIVAYNDLLNLINDDDAQNGMWKFREILSHQGPLTTTDPGYKGSRWNVHVLWETGEITIEPLKNVHHEKALCGIYARKHNLLGEKGWTQFRRHARREQKLLRMANQAKLHSFRTAPIYMFGHQVPRNHSQAVEMDEQNGNTKWQDAEEVELNAVLGYGVFNDTGYKTPGPTGHKRINVHFVFAVKHDGRFKA